MFVLLLLLHSSTSALSSQSPPPRSIITILARPHRPKGPYDYPFSCRPTLALLWARQILAVCNHQ
eukprot:9004561-Pyramimonas_sp.AAC.1